MEKESEIPPLAVSSGSLWSSRVTLIGGFDLIQILSFDSFYDSVISRDGSHTMRLDDIGAEDLTP